MKLSIKEVLVISRPRFWMYVLGPFLIGMIAAGNPFEYESRTIFFLLSFSVFFSLPANLLIYGINDIYDYDTDILNDKKFKYEAVLKPEKHKQLWYVISFLVLCFIPLFFLINTHALLAVVVFVFTGLFYSALPIRAKTKPPLDVLFSSIIYVSPAVIGYFLTGNFDLQWLAVLGGLIWAFGMQTYSAVPDIDADKKANVATLATKLGEKNALYFCLAAYTVSAIIAYFYVGYIALAFGFVYGIMVILSIVNSNQVFKYYTYFPLINTVAGALLFFFLFFKLVL